VQLVLSITVSTFSIDLPTFEVAVSAFPEAQAALRRCKRLLPGNWAAGLVDGMAVAEGLLPAVQARLDVLQGARSGSISWAGVEAGVARISAAARAGLTAMATMPLDQSLCMCDSCGQAGVGVRRCSRCRQAQYCRFKIAACCSSQWVAADCWKPAARPHLALKPPWAGAPSGPGHAVTSARRHTGQGTRGPAAPPAEAGGRRPICRAVARR
jgi:hypothetical protein